ncbi:MAG: Autotransporter-associated beta strand repeat protein, partial [Verrucomicrobiales bacterium]|nr:Autotransporter-associated beta strand repeat protein [Verrucomicrobiales bacterium]
MHSRSKVTSGSPVAFLQFLAGAFSGTVVKRELRPRMKITTLIAAFAVALISNVHGGATLYYWDINGVTNGSGPTSAPSGTWSSTTAFWNSSSSGTSAPGTFPFGNAAVFSAGTNATNAFTVTVGSAQTVDSIFVEEGSPTLTGTFGITLNGAATIGVLTGSKLSVANVLSGSAGLTKSGDGTLSLTGVNTFIGPVNLNAGILALTTNTALGSSTSPVNFNGGTLRFESTGTGSVIASGRSIILNAGGG